MRKNQYLSSLLATTMICGAASFATPAFAQDTNAQPPAQPAQAAPPSDEETVVVTGSRIPQPNLTATSPVTVVNSAEVRATGTTRAEDLVNSLPQVFAGQSSTYSNGASGTATLNLRGLGSNRTLVLINGRRLVPGDPGLPVPDINVIPAMMIQRVDVLTGGASSVYGADAVAGVVNFIMDTNFTGVRVDSQYSFYQHDNGARSPILAALNAPNRNYGYPTGSVADGGTWDMNMAIGAAFDDNRGHVVMYAGYRRTNSITQGRRDYSSCALTARTAAQIAAGPGAGGVTDFTCGGSATSANGTFFTNLQTLQVGPNRTFIPGSTPYNFAPTNYYQRPDERYTLGAFGSYEISEALKPYLEVMFMDDRTVAQIAPSGDFGNTISINCDNPLMSAQQRALVCQPANLFNAGGTTGGVPAVFIDPITGTPYNKALLQILRRNVEGGGRRDDLQHTNYRIVAGMNGSLSDAWSYDMYYQFGQTNFAETYSNDFSVRRLNLALDVIDNPATPGVDPICRSAQAGGTDPSCVPWDIFATGQVTPAALTYLSTPGLQRGVTQESVANASITGDLGSWGLKFPWANNGVGIAAGVEYRRETLELLVDQAFSTLPSSDLAGQGAPTLPVSGNFDVKEAFVEVRIPIVEDNFIYSLALEGGYRYSDYGIANRSFSTDTYKVGVDFAPIRDIRFRATYNRAVRAPNIQELFAPQRVVLDGSTDPCAGAAPSAPLAACQNMGVTAGQYGTIQANPANQYNGLVGGNPNLDPEIADTYTIGVVLQPRWIPHLAITVDWFKIDLNHAIAGVGADQILINCVAGQAQYCALVHRDQFGSLWRTGNGFVSDLSLNIGSINTRGIDVQASYSMDLGSLGGLSLNFVGTWLDKIVTDGVECVGLFGAQCGTPSPEWRHTVHLTWNGPDGLGFTGRWRYFSGVDNDGTSARPADLRIPSQNYFDLTLTARIGDHYNFRLGVNNILDKDPPIVGANACPAGICNGNAYTQVYDALGRYIFAGISLDF